MCYIYYVNLLISLIVATISFWHPLSVLSFLLAFAGFAFDTISYWGDCIVRKKLGMVGLGIDGTSDRGWAVGKGWSNCTLRE